MRSEPSRGHQILAVAFGLLVVGLVWFVREVRRVPRPRVGDPARLAPITDVAGRSERAMSPRPGGSVARTEVDDDAELDGEPVGVAKAPPLVLPPEAAGAVNAVQWTRPLAVPGAPRPPDPFTPPPIAQDAERGRRAHGPP